MEKMLLDAINRINIQSVKYRQEFEEFGFCLAKLMLAIQGNEAALWLTWEEHKEDRMKIEDIVFLCKSAQTLTLKELNQFMNIDVKVKTLVNQVVESQIRRNNTN